MPQIYCPEPVSKLVSIDFNFGASLTVKKASSLPSISMSKMKSNLKLQE